MNTTIPCPTLRGHTTRRLPGAYDRATLAHSFRVAREALRLGAALSLPQDMLEALAVGALLHDLGKIGVPRAVLQRPGPLSARQRRLVERHVLIGERIGRRLGLPSPVLAILRSHHERWDGSGYPDHLVGKAVPLLARIVSIVDVYDALTWPRPYRQPWPPDEARRYLLDHAGRWFDPRLVQAWATLRWPT